MGKPECFVASYSARLLASRPCADFYRGICSPVSLAPPDDGVHGRVDPDAKDGRLGFGIQACNKSHFVDGCICIGNNGLDATSDGGKG